MAKPKNPKKLNGDAAVPAVEAPIPAMEASAAENNPVTKRSSRKPTIVRSESRATVVPINLEEEIRRLAYLLSERRGFEPGHETEDWLAAEHEILQRYHHQSA